MFSGNVLGGGGPLWSPYTPAFTWIQGNGLISGRYAVLGQLCFFQVKINIGSTSVINVGTLYIGLPISVSGNILRGMALGTQLKAGVWGFISGSPSSIGLPFGLISANEIWSTGPSTWITGDIIVISGLYEIT